MRIGGMASGLDTEQMVKDLMRAERVRVDKYFRQEESLKWKREALNTTNKTLAEFILKARSDFGLSRTTSTGTIVRSSTQSFDWVKKVSSSNESAVKATASASALEGTHKIEVTQLAEVASVTSKDIKSLLDADGKFTSASAGEFDITVAITGGTTKTAKVNIAVGATMTDVVNQINNAVDADNNSLGLRAAYDSTLGKMMITTKGQGSQQITINAAVGSLATSLASTTESVYREGQNAKIYLNGDPNAIEKDSNNFSMFGVNYQLQSVGVSTVNVESNVDGIMDKVKGFVEDYNAMIDNLNGQLKAKSYRDFQPLTKEEREAMTEKEIELWEEKAKSGLLRNDESITRMLQTMRSGLYDNVYTGGTVNQEGTPLAGFKHLTELGITTGNYQSGGKLEINEEKLRAAINANPDGVVQLLFKTSDIKVPDGNGEDARIAAANKRANTGLVERLFNDMIGGMKEIVRRSGTGEDASLFRNVQSNMLIDFVTSGSISVMDRSIMNIGTRIANEERLLMGREDRYWRQFTAMEKALEKMNQQSGWLQSQLGQMR
jgi:flagellar hook-associated protein 2